MKPNILLQIGARVATALANDPTISVSHGGEKARAQTVVENAIANDPVLVNELNAEPPVQSRVGWGGTIGTIGSGLSGIMALGMAMGWVTPEEGAQLTAGVTGLVGAAGAAYALYGRFAKGLKPLFSK